ncbi:MAG: hemerythrin domain-containing protein [Rhodocyclaceae bacterium]|nr:hemerythrin domain-containing protein [Rhodocyclaceae bacterium]
MKRCPELQNLSREHHAALRLAVHLKRAAASGDDAEIETACAHLREVFDSELLPHFREEELCLLPCLESAGGSAVVARTLIEHRTLQRLVRELEIPDADTLRRFAELMTEHVRFEERELFDAAENLLGRETLGRILRHDEAA